MLLLISEVISNSNAVIRQDFRKLRFQMIDDNRLGDGEIWAQLGRKIPFFYTQVRSSKSVRPTDSTGLSELAIGSIPIARSMSQTLRIT